MALSGIAKHSCPVVLLGILGSGPCDATSADPAALFRRAVQLELEGSGPDVASRAFALYHSAARGGLAEAELNVAVMLDSGRGVAADIGQAAAWYARAAARGSQRAAYNLGQLYESGEGVPRNAALARAWFAASNLPAAGVHLAARRPPLGVQDYTAPMPVAPGADEQVASVPGGVELVWTAQAQPGPSRFFVEVRAVEGTGSREVLNRFVDTSSLLAPLPVSTGTFAWRVSMVSTKASRYMASAWSKFTVRQAPESDP